MMILLLDKLTKEWRQLNHISAESNTLSPYGEILVDFSFSDRLFCGCLSSVMKSTCSSFQCERKEPFHVLSVVSFHFLSHVEEVLNHATLEESLKSFTCVEEMTGTNQIVTLNNQKEDGTLQTRIHQLPPILFIQLKRFTYSPSAQSVQKLNSFFSFPLEMDMGPFTDNNHSENVYCLQSVFIHGGTLSAGHYYSYVCTQRNGVTPVQWCMVNDVRVEEVSIQEVLERSFGKKEEVTLKRTRREAERDDLYVHSSSDPEEKFLSGKSRLRLDGGRDEFILDARTTSAYVLVYVQKSSLEDESFSVKQNSSFIRKLLLMDMESRVRDYFVSQAIQLDINSLSPQSGDSSNTAGMERTTSQRKTSTGLWTNIGNSCASAGLVVNGTSLRDRSLARHPTCGQARITR